MHAILNPVGSHGDVHPFVGLGRALADRGHRVTLVTAAPFRGLAERHGFGFVPAISDADYHALTHNPDLWHPSRSLKVVFDALVFPRSLRATYHALAGLYEPGNTVLVGGTLAFAARLAHETLGVPYATVDLQPSVLMSVTDPPVFSTVRMRSWWPHWLRRLLYRVGDRFVMGPLIGPPLNAFRRELGLAPLTRIWERWRHSPQLVLGFFPEWFGSAADWPPQFRHVGFVRYDQGEAKELPGPVRDFLDAGPPPVAVSFGSAMRFGKPYFEAATAACRQLGVRALLLAKGGEQVPHPLPPGTAHFDYAPFSLVFPRAAAAIHHGGIGTSAQALTAGVPQLVMPLSHDQPDNAHRLARLGVARQLWPSQFTAANVATVLGELLQSTDVAAACRAAAEKMAADDPLDKACRLIEGLNGTDRTPPSPAT